MIRELPKRFVLSAIRAYQKTFSPDHGPLKRLFPYGYCRFNPTCSDYTLIAVDRFGITKGLWLSMRRIGRCNPWNKGGFDNVPERK
jgi:hypothetical protein